MALDFWRDDDFFLIFQIGGHYLQKVNAKYPQISDEKKVLPLWHITFDPLKNI
jgi:hypothetical protein